MERESSGQGERGGGWVGGRGSEGGGEEEGFCKVIRSLMYG